MLLPLLVLMLANAPSDTVALNNMRVGGGALRGNTLTLQLEAREGTWFPDGPEHTGRVVAAFAEAGKQLQNPGPMIRVKRGTEVRVTVHNTLKVPMKMFGLGARRGVVEDSVEIPAGGAHEFAFSANEPGLFYYAGKTTGAALLDRDMYDSQLNGVIVVDEGDAVPNERIFLISWWGSIDTTTVSGLMDGATITFNGASWPHTDRLHAVQNETQHYRFVNVTSSGHPLHLHGFYFSVDGYGNGATYKTFAPEQRQKAVTHGIKEGETLAISWTPTRPGNWILHCHIAGHISTMAALNSNRRYPEAHAKHSDGDPHKKMMEAMVLGIHVEPRGAMKASEGKARDIRLVAQSRPKVYGEYAGYAYSVAAENTFNIPGPLLLLEQNQPVAINIVNRTHEPAGVHWHGIELDSYPDGVPMFSGMGEHVLQPIAVGDSLTVRFTPPRAGTFMYHSHMNEMQQIGSGLYGPIIVLPKGEKYDPEYDRVLLLSDNGPIVSLIHGPYPRVLLNGSLDAEMRELRAGKTYRFRIINIRAETRARLELMDGDKHVDWKIVARDGADLPDAQITTVPANLVSGPGMIWDVEFTPTKAGTLKLKYGYVNPAGKSTPPASVVDWVVR